MYPFAVINLVFCNSSLISSSYNLFVRDVQVRRDALSALVRLTQEQGACRPAIGNFGGLKVFVSNLRSIGGHTKDGLPFLKCIDACTRNGDHFNHIFQY